jgi:hypothetical protein
MAMINPPASFQKSNLAAPSRRIFCSTLAAASISSFIPAGTAMANTLGSASLEDSLQSALHAIGSPVCIAAAEQLSQRPITPESLTLHLRSAGITSGGAVRIADALASVSPAELAKLGSFSLSYNPIGDEGAVALAAVLPKTLTELGLVGCSISDLGADALLKWSARASGIIMICIENNNLSENARRSFRKAHGGSSIVSVYV